MPIQSIWLCDTGSGKHRQIVHIQLPTNYLITWLSLSKKIIHVLWQGKGGATWKAGKEYQVLQNIQANGWRRQMLRLMWWNSWSSLHTYLVYGHNSKSSVKAVHVKLPHKNRESWKEVNFQVQSRPVSPSPYQSALEPHIQHVNHRVSSCMYEQQQGGWRLTWESRSHCDHVVLS